VSGEALALGITFLIHVVGLCLLFGLLLTGDDRSGWREWWPRDDGGGGSPPPPDEPRPPGPPLPDAEPSVARLREPGRLADAHPQPARRPEHGPQPMPTRRRERA
jgi:hypothetical protein